MPAASQKEGRGKKQTKLKPWLRPEEPESGWGGGKAQGPHLKPRGRQVRERAPGRNRGPGRGLGGCGRRGRSARERKENVEEAKACVDRAEGQRRGGSGLRRLRGEGEIDGGGRRRKDKVQGKV